MHPSTLAVLATGAITATSSATFVNFVVNSANATNSGRNLVVYTVWARFNGVTDTMLNAFNFGAVGASSMTGFWHKDNAYYNSGVLMQGFGTWNPSQSGSISLNRPYDSFLTIGGQATPTNTTNADPSWVSGGNADARSWNRPDLPNNGTLGWFNSNPPNLQGRVGQLNNTATDVRIGQFVLSLGDNAAAENLRVYTLTLGYNSGVVGAPVQFATSSFSLPAPGACALLGLAGIRSRRRRN